MVANLFQLVDVAHATATVPADLEREMARIKDTVGIGQVNSLARGALNGARQKIDREILAAVCGAGPGLASSLPVDRREEALRMAAAGGFLAVARELLQVPGVDAAAKNEDGTTALMAAAQGGHREVVAMLEAHIGAEGL